jgi:hypothetical protein
MVKVCGGTENCDSLSITEGVGSRSLEYKVCGYTNNNNVLDVNYSGCKTDISQITDAELRSNTPLASILDGVIYWGSVDFDDDGKLKSVDEYMQKSGVTLSEPGKEKTKNELTQLQNSINTAIDTIESDPTVKYCTTGREVQGMKIDEIRQKLGSKEGDAARFPDLTKQMRMLIAISAVKVAHDNYNKKYDELNKKLLADQVVIGERLAKIQEKDAAEAKRATSAKACKALATGGTPANIVSVKDFIKISGLFPTIYGGIAAPFSGMLSFIPTSTATFIPTASDLVTTYVVADSYVDYKSVTTTFNWDTSVCTKVTKSKKCDKIRYNWSGHRFCKSWGGESTETATTQF